MTNTIASMINYFDAEKNNHDYLEHKLIPTLANRHTYALVVGEFDGNTSRAIEKMVDGSAYHKKPVIVDDDVSTLHQLHNIFKHHSNDVIIFKDTDQLLSYPELLDYMNSIIEKSEYQVLDTTNQFTGNVILISKRLASIPDGIKSRANIIIKRSIFDLIVLWLSSVTSYFTF